MSNVPKIEEVAVMHGVREYAEEMPVKLEAWDGRLVVGALNEFGYNGTAVDLIDLIAWLHANRPDLLEPSP